MYISGLDCIATFEGGTHRVNTLNGTMNFHHLDFVTNETPRPSQLYWLEAENTCLRRPILISHPNSTMLDVLLPHFIASSSCMASDSTAYSCSCRSNQHDRKNELAGFRTFNWMLEYLRLRRVSNVVATTSSA